MSNIKYLLLTANGEPNIAIIKTKKDDDSLYDNVKTALNEHFDREHQINSIEELSNHPIHMIVKFSYMDDDDNIELDHAYLDETWLYGK